MAMLPRGGSGSGGDGSGGCCGPEEININMTGCCDGDGDGGGGGSGGGGVSGVSVHNELDGLQGGKADEYYHLTEAEYRRLPIRPVVMSPKNGAAGVNQVPQIVGSPYAHPYDVPMRAKHCQIATDAAFSNVVWEEEAFSASVVWQVLLKPDNTPYVQPNTKYFVRIRYQDRLGRWSDWSEASAFTTMAVFPDSVILTPIMLMPTEGGELPPVNPILAMSSPKMIAGSANFDAADWQVTNDQSFETTLYSAAANEDVTVHKTEGLNLATALGAAFYARGRQRTSTGEWSPWAVPVSFVPRPDYDDPIFGMRRIFSRRHNAPLIWNIDPEGKQVYIPPAYFDRHPLYSFPVQDIPIGDTGLTSNMAFVAPCWIKLNVYDNDDGDMAMDLWFSATPQSGDGWMLHPAFAQANDGLFIDTCLVAVKKAEDNKYYFVSAEDLTPTGYGSYKSYLTNTRNAAPNRKVWDIYARRLLLDLMTCEYTVSDPNRISNVTKPSAMTNRFTWRPFYGLVTDGLEGGWDSYQMCDGIVLGPNNNGIGSISLMHPNGNNLQMEASLTPGTGSPVSVLRGEADVFGFDLAMLGIVSEFATGADYRYFGTMGTLTLSSNNAREIYFSLKSLQLGLYALMPYSNDSPVHSFFRMSSPA